MGIILVCQKPPITDSNDNRPRLDVSYFKSLPGILKLTELALDLIILICAFAGPYAGSAACSGVSFMRFVAVNAFINTTIWLAFYVANIFGYIKIVPWVLVEIIYCGICVLFYLIGSSFTAACATDVKLEPFGDRSSAAYVIASTLGFIAMLVYLVDALVNYQIWRAGGLAPNVANVDNQKT